MVGTADRVTAPGTIPRLWPGETAVCIASGPSLTAADVDYCRGRARVIVVNKSILLAPWADVFYACDGRGWGWWKDEIAAFGGLKFSMDGGAAAHGATVIKNAGVWGLSTDPGKLANGRNSGYQAVNLAALLGATRILMLGYDMQQGPHGETHWHGDHPNHSQPPYGSCAAAFKSMIAPLATLGVTVINCSRRTALTCFPQMPIEEALPA